MSDLLRYRHAAEAGLGTGLGSPFNEAFSFTEAEYAGLKRCRPELFDKDPKRRRENWVRWSHTSEGKAFRVR